MIHIAAIVAAYMAFAQFERDTAIIPTGPIIMIPWLNPDERELAEIAVDDTLAQMEFSALLESHQLYYYFDYDKATIGWLVIHKSRYDEASALLENDREFRPYWSIYPKVEAPHSDPKFNAKAGQIELAPDRPLSELAEYLKNAGYRDYVDAWNLSLRMYRFLHPGVWNQMTTDLKIRKRMLLTGKGSNRKPAFDFDIIIQPSLESGIPSHWLSAVVPNKSVEIIDGYRSKHFNLPYP